MDQRPVLLTRNFYLLFVAHLFFGLSFWPYVLLPVFLQGLGSGLTELGIIMALASVAGMIIRPWIGFMLDHFGRRRSLLFGGVIFFCAHLLYLTIDRIGPLIYVVRFVHGFGIGTLFASLFTIAADISPLSRRAEGIALFGVAGHLSGAIGVLLAEEIVLMSGFSALFLACAGFTAIFILIVYFVQEPAVSNKDTSFTLKRFIKSTYHPLNRIPFLVTVLFAFGLVSYMTFLKPFAQEQEIRVTSFFFAYSLSAVFVRLLAGNWPDRFGLKTVLYPSLISLSIGIMLIIGFSTPAELLLSGILCGIGHGFIFPILSVFLINRAPDSERASRMVLFTLCFDLGIFIGSPLLGFVAEAFGYRQMFMISAIAILLSIPAFMFLDREPVLAHKT